MSNGFNFMIGADPELFVVDRATGAPVSAHDLIPGTKKAPHKVRDGAIQPDGLAAEFNIEPVPFEDFKAFDAKLTSVLNTLKDAIGADRKLMPVPSIQFDKDYYEALPESAKELGCDPDFCAYSEVPGEANKRPDGTSGLRSAAGHIHVGWGADIPIDHPDHVEVCRSFIRNLDCFVGLAMTVLDTDARRRELYGKAGAYRPKSYGVEYRTPSNAWLLSPRRRSFVHGLIVKAIRDMQTDKPTYTKKPFAGVQSIINDGNVAAATELLKTLGITVPKFEEA